MKLNKAKQILEGLKKNKELREKYKNTYKEIKSFLKDYKKKKEKNSKPQTE